ncbi:MULTISPECIES: hypothetical protein [unclassified Chryseobacterium]|uniref:hypothetical protein n=1 Tax=unclassified Chryseobacterium TaxID=2593645 RepID=UPI00301A0BFD
MSETTLEINLNEDYKIKIEKGNTFNDSIFKNVYKSALSNILDIIKQSENSKDAKYDDFNNIIAFTGERGKGKSSSMISFRDALINKSCSDHESFFNINEIETFDYNTIKSKTFADIDIIDPSLFRGESIFEIILAKMFQKFQDTLHDSNLNMNQDDKRELLKHFQNVFQNLQIINSDPKELYKKESIEALSKLAISSNLRLDFKNLVKCYLEKFENNKSFLIIAIDDFDLNFSNTYLMLEDVRQFLIQPNLIVLISLNKIQLADSLYNSFLSELHTKYPVDKNVLRNRASKYIEKLIPISRMIELPNFTLKDEAKIIDIVKIRRLNDYTQYSLKERKINSLYEFLIFYLSSKLNVLIPNYSFRQNLIIPKTLREIKELVQNAYNSDYNVIKKYILIKSYNDLGPEFSRLFNSIETNENSVLLIVQQFFLDELSEFLDDKVVELIDGYNPDNVSIGDIISLFENIEKNVRINNVETLRFLDYTKILVSLLISHNNLLKNTNRFFNNGIDLRLPREYSIRRDWVKFNIDTKLSDFEKSSSNFLIFSLIHIYGDPDYNYRKSTHNYFFRFFENFTQGVLDPFAIFTNYLEIKQNLLFEDSDKVAELYSMVEDYDEIFLEKLDDPAFTQEFIHGVSNFAFAYRGKQPDYFHLMYIYLYRGGVNSLGNIRKKNRALVNDRIIKAYLNFPLFKIWKKEIDDPNSIVRKVINKMYDSSKEDNAKRKKNQSISKVVDDYLKKDLWNKRTLTYFKNKIIDIDPNSSIIKLVEDFYDKIDTVLDEDRRLITMMNFQTTLTKAKNG